MQKFKGTPGLWEVNPNGQYYNGNKAFEIKFGTDGECIAEVVHVIEDANVMAAAPDMLNEIIRLNNGGGLGFDVHDRLEALIDKALGL